MEELNIIEKITGEILNVDDSIVIAERDVIEGIIDELEEYNHFIDNYDELFVELEDCDVLALVRYENEFYIEYPFDEDDELEDYCCCDKIMVQDGILFDKELEGLESICDELFTFKIIEEECDGNCEECVQDELEPNEESEDDVPEEINDLIDGAIENINNGDCLKCTLLQLYQIAYKDGINSICLGLSDILNDIVEEN